MKILIFLHVLGAVLLIGNVITAAFWKLKSEAERDLAHLHKIVKNVMLADFMFTLPGILLIIIPGVIMSHQLGYSFTEFTWLTLSLGLFALTGIVWLLVLLPKQRQMIKESKKSMEEGQLTTGYKKASRVWDIWGTVAIILPLAVLYLMVAKPF